MAQIDLDNDDDPYTPNPAIPPAPNPGNIPNNTDAEAFQDPKHAEAWLQDLAKRTGSTVERSDIAQLQSKKPEDFEAFQRALEDQYKRRGAPTSDRRFDSQSSNYNQATNQLTSQAQQAIAAAQRGAGRTSFAYNAPGDQFDDPYTKALEDLLKQNLAAIQQPQANPQLDSLLAFLQQQFAERSQNPGYSPAEQALLRTQALEPIERDRAAAQRRSTERMAARGLLPSSGISELESRDIDLGYDQLRGAAQRDLGINAIGRRDQNLAQALTLGQLAGIQIPQMQRAEDASRRGEAVGYANALYNLPRQAQSDALSVISGSPLGANLFNEAIQLMSAQENQRRYNQQQSQAMWYQIGQILEQLFGGRR